MSRIITYLSSAVLVLTLCACSDDGNGSGGDGSGDDAAGDQAATADGDCPDTAQVDLDDPGAEPRQAMELSPTVGDSMELETYLTYDDELVVDGEEQNMVSPPDMFFGMVVTVEDVSDDRITMSFVFDEAAPGSGSHVAMEDAVRDVAGFDGNITTTRTGAVLDAEIAGRPTSNEGAGHEAPLVFGDLEWQLTEMAVPFPEEPVGVGAEWSTRASTGANGVEQCWHTEYTLVALDGDSYEVQIDWVDEYAPEVVEEDGETTELVSGSRTSSTTSTGDLEFPLPAFSSTEITGESVHQVEKEDGTQVTEEHSSRYERGFDVRSE
ncbi:hypothetical protein [Phytoactinopolyspora endophytica]|uniref:hypothetical protein n=1 Tax=Phytoactinopolyspora endophytica TaxID=1642495 RepID=UPI00101C7C4F|nr:hypothetical protein [Phytoactinopolyspora endophytica]